MSNVTVTTPLEIRTHRDFADVLIITLDDVAVDISAWTFRCQIRPYRGSATILATITFAHEDDGVDGRELMTLTKAQCSTAAFVDFATTGSKAVMDLEVTRSGYVVTYADFTAVDLILSVTQDEPV